jgi:hypothetical protein
VQLYHTQGGAPAQAPRSYGHTYVMRVSTLTDRPLLDVYEW